MAETVFRIDIDPSLEKVDKNLATYAALTADLRPYWLELGRALAAESAARWPLKRRSGRLRRSLTWAGSRLGRGGIFQATRDRLLYGSRLFYADFAQRGTKRQPATPLVHVDEDAIARRLNAWSVDRARRAGFSEVSA